MGKITPEEEIKGKRYGRLTIIGYSERKGSKSESYVYCKCDCGNTKEVCLSNLKYGNVKSCGCLRHETLAKHHKAGTRLYNVWSGMKQRCYCKTCKSYKDYGGRGITICPEWLENFENFENWAIKNGYEENADYGKQTIERIDVNGNYEPSNCKFATMLEQGRNKTNTVKYEVDGEEYTLAELSEKYNVSLGRLTSRVYDCGWDIKKALAKEKDPYHDKGKQYTFNGKTMNLTEWAKELEISRTALEHRIKTGRPPELIFTNKKHIHILRNKKAEE